ncbi:MAG: hypothetical protein HYV32_06415 [Candidatus Kerfeldbacteria bacterium]|nr:hypothetical protein [Candidatus Kerfeldbacteria bacterium]
MKNKKWFKVLVVFVIIIVIIAIIIFLGFQKHTLNTTVLSCTEKNLVTTTGKYRFPPQWGLEGYKILVHPQPGGMFDAIYPNQICNSESNFVHEIIAIEYTGLGYITAIYVR